MIKWPDAEFLPDSCVQRNKKKCREATHFFLSWKVYLCEFYQWILTLKFFSFSILFIVLDASRVSFFNFFDIIWSDISLLILF